MLVIGQRGLKVSYLICCIILLKTDGTNIVNWRAVMFTKSVAHFAFAAKDSYFQPDVVTSCECGTALLRHFGQWILHAQFGTALIPV